MSIPLWKLNRPGPSTASGGWSKKTVRGSPRFERTACGSWNGFSGHGYAAAAAGQRRAAATTETSLRIPLGCHALLQVGRFRGERLETRLEHVVHPGRRQRPGDRVRDMALPTDPSRAVVDGETLAP